MRQRTKRTECLVEALLLSNGTDHSLPQNVGGENLLITGR